MDLEKLVGKSAWKRGEFEPYRYFCPHCGTERKIVAPPEPQVRHYFQVAVAAAFFTALFWPVFDLKGLVSFIPMWMCFEAVYRIRARARLVCDECNFDPSLYLVDSKLAREQVDEHFKKKFAELGIPFPEPTKDKRVATGKIVNEPAYAKVGQAPKPKEEKTGAKTDAEKLAEKLPHT